ncbi:MAG: family 16 glycosylhydrolase [Saprospiraceae bacterium]|nr:family 16 glycosylhydrolase [Saprospiraceae bacterium]
MKFQYLLILFLLLMSCGEEMMPEIQEEDPLLSMDPLAVIEGDNQKSVFVSLRLNKKSSSTITAILETVDGTASSGEDYVGFSGKSIEITPGSIQTECKVEIIGDEVFENDETFKIKVSQLTGADISNSEVTITIENDDENTQLTIPSTGYTTPSEYDGMNLLWADEFDGEELNEEHWTYEIGNGSSGWGNNELQFYRKENTFLTDGNLVIRAKNEVFNGFNYTSSRLITKDKVEFTHGRVDIRAVIPEGQGIWPALWMLGANISEVGWPRCGEIDIMELVGHEPSKIHGTVHYPDPGGNRLFRGDEISLSGGKKFSQEFHVFSIIWKENLIQWFMDDQLFYTVTPSSLGNNNPYPFNEPFFFIFNIAVGGDWPGSPDGTTMFPQHMIVDYIRIFQE